MSSSDGRVTVSSGISPPSRRASSATTRVGVSVRTLWWPSGRQPAHRCLCRGPAAELGGGIHGADAPAGDDADPVRQRLRLVQVVRGEQDRGPAVGQALDEVPELPPRLGVEAGGRLVKEEQFRAADDAERHVHPAALPPGQLPQLGARLLGQPDGLDDLVGVPRVRIVGAEMADHLAHRKFRGVGVALQHDADPRPPFPAAFARVGAKDGDLAAVAAPVPLQDLDRRGLARAVRAEQGEDLAVPDVQVDTVDSHGVAI